MTEQERKEKEEEQKIAETKYLVDQVKKNLPNRLKGLREGAGLSLEEMGRILSLSKSSVSRYEYTGLLPSIKTIACYAEYFNMSIQDVVFGDKNDIVPDMESLLSVMGDTPENIIEVIIDLVKLINNLFHPYMAHNV